MGQIFPIPARIERFIARLGRAVDRQLPGRARGRLGGLINRRGQRYLAPRVEGSQDFVRRLQQGDIVHSVLAEETSSSPMMVLIGDDDTERIRDLLSKWPTGDAIDVYATTGPKGFAYGDMPLLPPRLARLLLEDAADANPTGGSKRRNRFLAQLYRIVFLEGLQSGIPPHVEGSAPSSRTNALAGEASRHGVELRDPISLEGLAELLRSEGWIPPIETLERIGAWNEFVATQLLTERGETATEPAGPAVFYIRRRAADLGLLGDIVSLLESSGFRILSTPALSPANLSELAEEVRGGNWGRGPFPVSGGAPARVVVAFDPAPIPPGESVSRQFPLLDNERIQRAKQAVRDAIHTRLPKSERFNALHSTDNAAQAWRAVRAHFPDDAERLYRQAYAAEDVEPPG